MAGSIGDRRIDQITSSDILDVLSRDWLKKPETARRVLQRLRLVFDWSIAKGFRTAANPTIGVRDVLPKHRAADRHHPAMPYAQVPAFVARLRSERERSTASLGLEFTILCAARTGETIGAKWIEIDLDHALWTIPAERMKALHEHRVPLSSRAVEILHEARSLNPRSEYVFPGGRPASRASNMIFLMLLRRMEVKGISVHGFRSSFRDWCSERTATPHAVAEAALAHRLKDKAEAAYNRTDLLDRRRELMNLWARYVANAPATVVAMNAVPA